MQLAKTNGHLNYQINLGWTLCDYWCCQSLIWGLVIVYPEKMYTLGVLCLGSRTAATTMCKHFLGRPGCTPVELDTDRWGVMPGSGVGFPTLDPVSQRLSLVDRHPHSWSSCHMWHYIKFMLHVITYRTKPWLTVYLLDFRRLVARCPQSWHHYCHHPKFCQQHQLPCCMAQDSKRETKVIKEMV